MYLTRWNRPVVFCMDELVVSAKYTIRDSQGNVVNVRAYNGELLIRNAFDGRKYLYDIIIKKKTLPPRLIFSKERPGRLP